MMHSASILEADVKALRAEDLRRVVEIYVALAYPSGELPDSIRRRLSWLDDTEEWLDLSQPPFEPAAPANTMFVSSLRLGNERYPHMKLQVQPWPTSLGFLVSVNTHDQVLAPEPGSSEADAFQRLQEHNQRIKSEIELAWDEAGLPTFLRYLRDYINAAESER